MKYMFVKTARLFQICNRNMKYCITFIGSRLSTKLLTVIIVVMAVFYRILTLVTRRWPASYLGWFTEASGNLAIDFTTSINVKTSSITPKCLRDFTGKQPHYGPNCDWLASAQMQPKWNVLLQYIYIYITWWRHQMETFSALLVALCAGIHRWFVTSYPDVWCCGLTIYILYISLRFGDIDLNDSRQRFLVLFIFIMLCIYIYVSF